MSEVGCEIFSSHSIFKANIELHGSTAQHRVIHTLMHSITQEIKACMLACQTLAGGNTHMLHYMTCHQFLYNSNYPGLEVMQAGFLAKQTKVKSQMHTNTDITHKGYADDMQCTHTNYTFIHLLQLMKLKSWPVTLFLKCIKY